MIELSNLSKYYGETAALKSLSLGFEEGESVCVMGPSGCGKTTLLHMLMGLVTPDSGSISGLEGKKIAPVFQDNRLCENLSAGANIRLVCGRGESADIEETLDALGLKSRAKNPVRELSGGMARRVAIARALCAGGDIYLFDEPFKGLDDGVKETVIAYVREKCAGKTVIWVTHDEREAELWGCGVIRLNGV